MGEEVRVHHGTANLAQRLIRIEDELIEEADTLEATGDHRQSEALRESARHVDEAVRVLDNAGLLPFVSR